MLIYLCIRKINKITVKIEELKMKVEEWHLDLTEKAVRNIGCLIS